jgi:hypothetical protein
MRVTEEVEPWLEVLDGVEEHSVGASRLASMIDRGISVSIIPIIASGSGGNAKNEGVEVELSQTRILGPFNSLKLRSLLPGLKCGLALRLAVEDAHLGKDCLDQMRL